MCASTGTARWCHAWRRPGSATAARVSPTACTRRTGGSSAWLASGATTTRWCRRTTGSSSGTSPTVPSSRAPPRPPSTRSSARASWSTWRSPMLTDLEVRATADSIADWQLDNGMILWFPGGHSDPWNHTEAAMALTVGGRRAEAERAYEWLASTQHDDGSWFNYYL